MKKMIDFKPKKLIANNGVYYMPYFKPYSKKLIQIIKRYKKEDIASGAKTFRKYYCKNFENFCN